MREKTTFISDDGYEFQQKEDCVAYETMLPLLQELDAVLNPTPHRDTAYAFAWRNHYIQQDPEKVKWVKRRLLNFTAQFTGETVEVLSEVDVPTIIALLGGVHGGRKFQPMRVLWERLHSTDGEGREFSSIAKMQAAIPPLTEYKP